MPTRETAQPSTAETWVPPGATGKVAEVFRMTVLDRVRMFMSRPSPETVESMILSSFTSYSPADTWKLIEYGHNVIPGLVDVAWLDNVFVRPWAKSIIRRNWDYVRYYLIGVASDPQSGPNGLLLRMKLNDSPIFGVFDTPQGRAWLAWTCYHIAVFFRTYSEVKDPEPIVAPDFPDPIRK